MTANRWPTGGFAGWAAYAAELQGRLALVQLHVEPDWLYALCSCCGWSREEVPANRIAFRFDVATHQCPVASTDPVPTEEEARLF